MLSALASNQALDALECVSIGIVKDVLKMKVLTMDQFFEIKNNQENYKKVITQNQDETGQLLVTLATVNTERDKTKKSHDRIVNEKSILVVKNDALNARLEAAAAENEAAFNEERALSARFCAIEAENAELKVAIEKAAAKKAEEEAAAKQAEEEAAAKQAEEEAVAKQAKKEAAVKRAKEESAAKIVQEEVGAVKSGEKIMVRKGKKITSKNPKGIVEASGKPTKKKKKPTKKKRLRVQ